MVFVEVLITVTVPGLPTLLATYAMVPAGFTDTPRGTSLPSGTVATTVLFEVSMTDRKPFSSVTYAIVPAGFTATPNGSSPTITVPTTVLLTQKHS